ncbi:MAG: cbb3-type cytochrome oxidase assembly protein CcoS [Planctomycetes bacterium]|nr:cbb3-type cytochrome oxidase assembly protein CcoS [Planctomycetota bacterium]
MSVIYILLPLALVLVILALWAFIHAVKTGQFDDLSTPAYRLLIDDEVREAKDKQEGDNQN